MAQFDPVVIPVNADVQEVERAFKRVAQSADRTAKSVENSFTNAFKNIGRAGGGIGAGATAAAGAAAKGLSANAGAAIQGSRGFLGKAGGAIGKTAGTFFALSDIRDALEYLGSAGKYLVTPTAQLKSFAQTAVSSSQQIITSLGQIGLAFQGIQGTVSLATNALSGFFNATVGREIKFRETILNIQTTIASTSKVFDKTGAEITKPLEKIKALENPVREAIRNIVRESENISGTTSEDIIQLFQLITTYSGQAKLSIDQAQKLATKFAAGLGTLGLPAYQAPQEIGSILSGTVDQNSVLAKKLGIDNPAIEKAKQSAGGLFKYINDRLETVLAGQAEAAKGFAGLTSNIQEVAQNVQQAFGKPLLDPILDGLNKIYTLITGTKEQFKAAAEAAGALVGKLSTSIVGGAFKGATNAVNSVRAELGKSDVKQQGTQFLQKLETGAAAIGQTLEKVLTAAGDKLDALVVSFGKLAVVIAQFKLDQFTTSIQTLGTVAVAYLKIAVDVQGRLVQIKAAILQALGPLASFVTAWKAVGETLGPIIKASVAFVGVIAGPLTVALRAVFGELKALVTGGTTVVETFSKITGSVRGFLSAISNALKPLKDFTAALKAGFQEGIQASAAKQAAQSFAEVKTAVTAAGEAAAKAGPAFKVVAETARETATGVKTARTEISLLVEAGGAGAKIGAALGKSFAALGPIFSGLVGIAKTLVVQFFAVQAVTAVVEAAITAFILINQQVQEAQKQAAEAVKDRAAAEDFLAGKIAKGNSALAERLRQEQETRVKAEQDRLFTARKQLNDVLLADKNGDSFTKNKIINDVALRIEGGLNSFGTSDFQALADTIKGFRKDIDKAEPAEQLKLLNRLLGNPKEIKKQLKEIDEQIDKLGEKAKQSEAARIESATATSLQKFQNILKGKLQFSSQDIGEIAGDLQQKLATSPVGTKQFEEVAARLKAAKTIADEASKTSLDRVKEEGQIRDQIAQKRLAAEQEARSIRNEALAEERRNALTGISDQTKRYLSLYEERRSREEQIADRIKQTALEIASVQRKAWELQLDKAILIKTVIESIRFPELRYSANQQTLPTSPGGFRPDTNYGIYNAALENSGNRADALYTFGTTYNRQRPGIRLGGADSFKRSVLAPGQYPPALGLFDNATRAGKRKDLEQAIEAGNDDAVYNLLLRYARPQEKERLRALGPAGFKSVINNLRSDIKGPAFQQFLEDPKTGRIIYQGAGSDVAVNYANSRVRAPGGVEDFYYVPGKPLTNAAQALSDITTTETPGPQVQASVGAVPVGLNDPALQRRFQAIKGDVGRLGITRSLDLQSQEIEAEKDALARRNQSNLELLSVLRGTDPVGRELADQLGNINQGNSLEKRLQEYDQELLDFKNQKGVTAAEIRKKEDEIELKKRFYKEFGSTVVELAKVRDEAARLLKRTDLTPIQRETLTKLFTDSNNAVTQFNNKNPVLTVALRRRIQLERASQDTQEKQTATDDALQAERELRIAEKRQTNPQLTKAQLEEELLKSAADPAAKEKLRASAARFWKGVVDTLADEEQKSQDELFLNTKIAGLNPRFQDRQQQAAVRIAVDRAGGLAAFNSRTQEEQNTAFSQALRTLQNQNRNEVNNTLSGQEDAIALEKQRQRALLATTDEERIQFQLEEKILQLRLDNGKTLTEDEQKRFVALARENLQLERQRRLLEAAQGALEQFVSSGFDALANEIDILFGRARQQGEDFFRSLQQAAADLFRSIGNELTKDFIKDTATLLKRQVGGLFGLGGDNQQAGTPATPPAAAIATNAITQIGAPGFAPSPLLASINNLLNPAASSGNAIVAQGTDFASALAAAAAETRNNTGALERNTAALSGFEQVFSVVGSAGGGGGFLQSLAGGAGLLGGLGSAFGGGGGGIISTVADAIGAFANPAFSIGSLPILFKAKGGVLQGGFRAFASGGIVNQPTLGLVGEGRFNEAVVPLPDGKSIPVQMMGGGGGVQIGSVNISVQNTGETLSVEAQRQIANQVRALTVEEIVRQQRAGGIIRQGALR